MISFSQTSGTSGVTTISISATSNSELVNIINNYTLSNDNGHSTLMPIVQKAYEPIEKYIIISPSAITWESSGGRGSLNLQSNDDWTIVSDGWIQLSRYEDETREQYNTLNGNGNTIIGIRASENTGSSRNGGITGYCKSDSSITATTTVSQDGSYIKPYINLGYYSVTASSESSTTAVSVSSNIDWYTICDSRWITLATQTGSGDGSISFTVDANTTEFNREGIITVFNAQYDTYVELFVRQVSSVKPYIKLEPQSFVVSSTGSTNTISVSANCDYEITTDVDWIILDASSGTGYGSVSFTTLPSDRMVQNAGNIVFSNSAVSSYVTVERMSAERYLSASTNSILSENTGGTFDVSVYSNVNWVVRVDTQEETLSTPWLSATPISGSNNGSIRISIESGTTEKTGSVVLSNSQYGLSYNIAVGRKKYVDGTKVYYTSRNGHTITPLGDWGANIISNTYQGGVGVITFDGNVTTVPYQAYQQTYITSIILPETITSIGNNAFAYSYLTGEMVIPDSVVSIGNSAFINCTGLTSLSIGKSVASIGASTFSGCFNLTGELNLPSSLVSIGSSAFNGCSGLTGDLIISNSVTEIGEQAFRSCYGFSSLTLDNSLSTIGNYAFAYCSGFTGNLTIPNSVTEIGEGAFRGCSGFDGELTISSAITTIKEITFENCSNLKGNLTIPNSVTSIEGNAFYHCSGFNGTLVIGNSVATISEYAFAYCRALIGDLVIPDSVGTLGSYAFAGCSGFSNTLILGNSLTRISNSCFSNCKGITEIYSYPTSQPSTLTNAFYGLLSGGTLHYPNGSDYSGFISQLPSSWTAVGDL